MPEITIQTIEELISENAELEIPTPEIMTEAEGFGLKNANTNFYSSVQSPRNMKTTIAGFPVEIEVKPVQWTWNYGDGTPSLVTKYPGYPAEKFNEETPASHVYTDTGEYTVTLNTKFTARYRLNGGRWQPIPGSSSRESEPVIADIWRQEVRNVYETCRENPNGWGCDDPFER